MFAQVRVAVAGFHQARWGPFSLDKLLSPISFRARNSLRLRTPRAVVFFSWWAVPRHSYRGDYNWNCLGARVHSWLAESARLAASQLHVKVSRVSVNGNESGVIAENPSLIFLPRLNTLFSECEDVLNLVSNLTFAPGVYYALHTVRAYSDDLTSQFQNEQIQVERSPNFTSEVSYYIWKTSNPLTRRVMMRHKIFHLHSSHWIEIIIRYKGIQSERNKVRGDSTAWISHR